MQKEIIILCGPTASGKSYFGHELAKIYNGEIINIDSMQIYKEIPIITASPSLYYQSEIPYHLYNFLPIDQEFSVIKYLNTAITKIKEISAKYILLIGGTGLYINSLLFGYNNIPDISYDIRLQVRELHDKIGTINLWKQLEIVDKVAAAKINVNDSQRLIRALEVFLQTDKSIFFYQNLPKKSILSGFNIKIIFLYPERNFLYNTCNTRLEKIFKNGAIEEITALKKHNDIRKFNCKAIGVNEILAYLDGKISLNEALNLVQTKTRQYAKRQITWFKNQITDKITIKYSNEDEFLALINQFLK